MAKFLTGNITKHINKMTMAGAIGIFSIFIVDFIDMYFLSILGESELVAAVGFSGVLLFMLTSIGIATMITMGSLVSKSVGGGDMQAAKRIAMNIIYFIFILSVPLTLLGYIFAPNALELLGAKGITLEYAINYFRIVVFSLPFLLIGMALNGLLRGIGDAKRSMMPTLVAGGVNVILDPILIFTFALGLEGAAIATAISRIALFCVALYGVIGHKFLELHKLTDIKHDFKAILSIFIPAMVTNISTPIGTSYMLKEIAKYGDDAVAGMAVIGRMVPLLFVYVFAMSGAIGSIVGQNFGAKNYERTREAILKSIYIAGGYVFIVSLLLALGNGIVIRIFDLQGDGKTLIEFYSYFIAIFFSFNALIFLGNSVFNVIGKAKYSMFLNLFKSLVLLIPLVFIFSKYYGMKGVLIGEAISFVITGLLTFYFLYKFIFCRCNK